MKYSSRIPQQCLLLIFSFLFSMGLFLAAYRYDNKYTLHTPQPIGGMLFFDPDSDSVTHLINGWQYYRGKLLAPEDFNGDPPLPDGYLSIGQYPGLEAGRQDASPHGSMTYGMILALPDTPASYTLELPEIYSAYRLYIGDTLAASCGTPDKEHYEPGIHSGSVTFQAAGNTRILLAVSDWSWIYSGLVYPPAFGVPKPVNTMLVQKFAWGLAVSVLAFSLGCFQMALCAMYKNARTLYSALICLAFAISACSPPVHQLMTTGIVPFYNLELMSRYAVYGAAVLLVNHLYGRRSGGRIAVSASAAAFPLVSLGISLAAPVLNLKGMLLFSQAAGIYKGACALWIIYTAYLISRKKESGANHLILLTGACVFASSLAADRLLPSFEPIRFGWYSDIAGLIFVLLISFLMFQDSLRIYRERLLLEQQKKQLEIQVQLQKTHYTDLIGQIQEIRAMRHDVRHHYTQLGLLLKNGDYESAEHYLNQINGDSIHTVPLTFCANHIADLLLRYYYAKAQTAGIPFSAQADLPPHMGLPDEDISLILGNVLENALEANLRLAEDERFLSLSITKRSNNLIIESSNPFDGKLKKAGNTYISSKEKDRAGIGISSVQMIAQKYSGNVWIDAENGAGGYVFTICILLITLE